MTSTSVKDLVMANKLKDGVQDAIVYLRMLEGAKLAPVYERKRRHLMEKLLDLQGDTRKEAPPKFDDSDDDDDEDEETSIESPSRRVERDSSSEGDGDKKKRTSKVFDARSRFEKPPQRFQYKTLEQIKLERLASKGQNQVKETQEKREDKEQKEEIKKEEIKKEEIKKEEIKKEEIEKEEVLEKPREDVKELEEDEEMDGNGKNEPEPTTPNIKSKSTKSRNSMSGGFMKKLFKGKERSMSSDTTSNDNISEISEDKISQSIDIEEDDEKEEEEEQKPFSTVLDRVTRKLGRYSYQSVVMTLLGESVKVCKPKDKDKGLDISLIGAAAVDKDSYQFELHTAQKSYTFRTDSEELCIKWVNALKEAIEVCNPVVEPIEEEIEEEAPNSPATPQIIVPEEEEKPKSNIRESVSYENFVPGKKKKEMPDSSTAQVKGYMYKKGKFGWDKCWVLLTNDNVVYIAPNETSKKIQSSIAITVETKVERKKGSDRFPHAVQITSGKTKDTFAADSLQDYSMWIYCLENACGCSDIQELLSEDEDADADAGELYEELELEEPQRAPFIPSSPRPSNSPFHTSSSAIPDDDIYEGAIDDDIYEGLDEIDIPKEIKTPNPPPALPSAPPPKFQPPSLPPRNVPPVQAPVLPPRPTKNTAPLDYEAPAPSPPSARKQTPAPIDDDVYDDVVVTDKQEQDLEETYDDIVSVTQPKKQLTDQVSSGDLYEDMTPDSSYVQMERHNEIDEEYTEMTLSGSTEPIDEDVYDDVAVAPPRPPPPSSSPGKTLSPAHKTTTPVRSSSPGTTKSPVRQSSIPTVSNVKNIPPKSSTLPKMSSPGAGHLPSSSAPKKLSTSGKVATLSKMFGTQPGESSPPSQIKKGNKKGNHSGTLLYKSPGKQAFSSEWCVLDGYTLIFYNGPNDKLSHYRLNLRDVVLMIGSPDGKGSVFAFHVKKGTYTHQFSVSSKEELTEWIGVLVSVVQKVSPNEEDLYRAVLDHEGTKEGEVSFQKGAIIWILGKDTSVLWTGVVGTSAESFTNASGVLPANKVEPFIQESVYF